MISTQINSSVLRARSRRQVSVGLLSAVLLLSAAPVSAEVIWRGDFETGTTEQWRGAPKSDGVKVVQDPVREGKYAVRIDGTNAARRGNWDRIEFQHQPQPPGTAEGTERYFGWSVFLPQKLTGDMHALGYFETRNSWRQLMSFEVKGEDIVYSTRVPYARRWNGKGKLTPGRWHDFAVHVLWSRDPAKGFVELWFDGEQVVERASTATLLDENPAFFQIGLFRDTIDVPESILIDHVIEATTLAEVTPPRLAEQRKAAAVPVAAAQVAAAEPVDAGDTRPAPRRPWDPERDFPPPVSGDASVTFDYPIVYVRVPRPYPKAYSGINHLNQAGLHQTNAPGAELRLLHPDGRDELLVPVTERESITDPVVSFDGEWVWFAKFHHMATGPSASMTHLQSREGSDIYKLHVRTRKLVQLTSQERTPNTGAVPAGTESHPRGVHNLAPCPVSGGRVVFVSDRNGYRGVREQTQPALQLFVMDEDGGNVELIGALNLGTALHPVALRDGRVMFSSLETQGLRSDERWGIWAIHPDGTNWGPLTSALGSPPGQAVHFQAQLSDESIVVESYYQTGSTDGFGAYWKFPVRTPQGQPSFGPAARDFAPPGIASLTLFASFSDVRPNHRSGDVNNTPFIGNVTHPSAAPDNHLLTVWAPPSDAQDQSSEIYDAGIYLLKSGRPINHPSKMRLIRNDPGYQEVWPRALVPYKRIYGIDQPPRLEHANDGRTSPQLPAGTPFGLVGTSSLYKRESFPRGVVPAGSVTAVAQKPGDRKAVWRDLAVARFGMPGNWGEQGADAGLYENSDIWGVRILVLEPVSDAVYRKHRHFALGSNAEERIRVLGEFPVRKFPSAPSPPSGGEGRGEGGQPLDPDGNPDTSFLAKVPADVAWTFQTLDNHGMVLNMAQTWHQVRPGEVRNNCGGCHAHSQQPTSFELTAAARPDYKVWDLTKETPLFTTKDNDSSGRKWDKQSNTGVRIAAGGVKDVEFYRHIRPLLERSCVACHSQKHSKPAGLLALDDDEPLKKRGLVPWAENVTVPQGLPRSYARLVQYAWAFQSRRSPLMWKVFGRRLDGFDNDDVPSPPLDYHDEQSVLNWCHHSQRFKYDVDYVGSAMPPADAVAGTATGPDGRAVSVPPLSDEEKLTLARWIDIGCPIDLDFDAGNPDRPVLGWMLDEGRPTLTLASPQPGANAGPLTRILIGMHDYASGLDMESFRVTADVEIDGAPAGDNLAPRFRQTAEGIRELKLSHPVAALERATLTVSIRDRQGNISRIERRFAVTTARQSPPN